MLIPLIAMELNLGPENRGHIVEFIDSAIGFADPDGVVDLATFEAMSLSSSGNVTKGQIEKLLIGVQSIIGRDLVPVEGPKVY